MDYKQVAFKVLKGAIYGAIGTIGAFELAGITDWHVLIKGLAGAAVTGAMHGAHDAIQQARAG